MIERGGSVNGNRVARWLLFALLAGLAALVGADPQPAASQETGEPAYAPDRIIVKTPAVGAAGTAP